MIRVIYAIFTIVIKDLEIYLINSNLLLRKNIIWFKLLIQKRKTDKQIASILFTNIKSLFHKSIYLFEKNIDQNSPFLLKSDYHNLSEISIETGN